MLKQLIQRSLENRFTFIFAFLLICAIGVVLIGDLPIDAVPDITNVQVMINTKTGALDPERIEKAVTYVIETEMSGLPGLMDIRSISKYGLSQVTLVFKDGTDLFFIRQQVSQRLQNLKDLLPETTTPELAPISTGLGEIVMYTVDAKPESLLAKKSEEERLLYLRTIQDYVIRPELKKIEGVADIDSSGGYKKEIHINADTYKMEKFAVNFDDLQKKLQTLGDSYGGGYIERNQKQIIVRSSSHLPDLKTLENFPIKLNYRGQPVLLRQVAGIRADHTQRLGAATSGGQQAVLGTALMYIGANSREVSENIVAALKQLSLPDDVETHLVYSRSYLVNATIHTVMRSLAEGAGLVILILLLLLGNVRAAVMVALAIPISMLFAVIGMRFFHVSANLMSLGAIDFGLLVDGSVVMIENILRRFEDNTSAKMSREDRLLLIKNSAVEVAKPVSLGILIIMLVYVPILSLEGIEGKMFHPMAATVLMALGASLLVALLLMPALGYLIISGTPLSSTRQKPKLSHSKLFEGIRRIYQPMLTWSLHHRKAILFGTVAITALSFILFSRLGSDFIPQLDEGDLVAGLVRRTDMSLSESLDQQKRAEEIILNFPEVQNVFSRIGTPESATDPMGVNFADTFIILKKDRSLWPSIERENGTGEKSPRSKQELMDAISKSIEAQLPGHEISPTQPIEMRFNEILEGSRADVSLRIYGQNLDRLIEYIDQSKAVVEKINGVNEAEMDSLTALRKSPVLNIDLNYEALGKYGVNLQSANTALQMAMSGVQIGNFFEEDRRFALILHLAEELRENPDEIKKIPVLLNDGGSIPLSAISSFSSIDQVTTIARSFGKRYAALSIFLKDRNVSSFVDEAKRKIGEHVHLPAGFQMEWGGQFKNLERARARLLVIIPLTLAVIFFLLQREFESLRLTTLVFLSIPVAATGGILALYLRGISFSISAAVGFIALFGIAILNSMVLVDFIHDLRLKGVAVYEAVETGALIRLRPVLMTALVAGLGFLPMALNQGMGAEVQRPLATVVIGGLITSTVLTLLVIPSFYAWIESESRRG